MLRARCDWSNFCMVNINWNTRLWLWNGLFEDFMPDASELFARPAHQQELKKASPLSLEHNIQKWRKICGLGCVNHACTMARVTQPGPHIFLHICRWNRSSAVRGKSDRQAGSGADIPRCILPQIRPTFGDIVRGPFALSLIVLGRF